MEYMRDVCICWPAEDYYIGGRGKQFYQLTFSADFKLDVTDFLKSYQTPFI